MRTLRAATSEQAAQLWPAARATRLFASRDEYTQFRLDDPWRVRATERGEGAVLSAWRAHLQVLAIRGLWCAEPRTPRLLDDIAEVAVDHGFVSVLSPLLPLDALGPYIACGFRAAERLVVYQAGVDSLAALDVAGGVSIRAATIDDIEALAVIDEWSFDTFWRYRSRELIEALRTEKVAIAGDASGVAVGYATCSVHGATATVGRLAVTPDARRRGVARSLLGECARWGARHGAIGVTLCTQEHNRSSRSLYRGVGMHELDQAYALAARSLVSPQP